jgi:hypothetical protein
MGLVIPSMVIPPGPKNHVGKYRGPIRHSFITIHSDKGPFSTPYDNTTRPGWVGYEEALLHVPSQYTWLILRGGVLGLGFVGFRHTHSGEIFIFFSDVCSPSDTEHQKLLTDVVELLDFLDLSVVSFLLFTLVRHHRYRRVLIIASFVSFLCVECVPVDVA